MKKFSFQEKLNGVLYLQGFRDNPGRYDKTPGHIGLDISRGDGDPIPAYYDGTVTYIQKDTIVYLTDPDDNSHVLEVSASHGKDFRVKVGDRVKVGQIICRQWATDHPSENDINDLVRVAWSHEHLNIREGIAGKKSDKSYIWDFAKYSAIPYSIVEYDSSMDHFRDPAIYSRAVLYLVANAIARKENMAKYHADKNNPGAIKSRTGEFLRFDTYDDGYVYLIDYLHRACTGRHAAYRPDMTVLEFFKVYSPSFDSNDPVKYARDIVEWVGLKSVNDPIADWLLTEVEWIKKNNYFTIVPAVGQKSYLNPILEAFRALWNTFFRGQPKVVN